MSEDYHTEFLRAVNWIHTVGEELALAGFPTGDRTVILASLRTALAELKKRRTEDERRNPH